MVSPNIEKVVLNPQRSKEAKSLFTRVVGAQGLDSQSVEKSKRTEKKVESVDPGELTQA
jgi:hypothetical protein